MCSKWLLEYSGWSKDPTSKSLTILCSLDTFFSVLLYTRQNGYKTNNKPLLNKMHNLILVFIDAYIGFGFKQLHPSLLNIHSCVTVNYKKSSWQLFKRTQGRFIGFLHPYKHDRCSQVQVYVVFVLCVAMLMSSAGGGVRLSPAPTSPRVRELSCPLHLLRDKGAQCGTCILHLPPPCHTHTHTLCLALNPSLEPLQLCKPTNITTIWSPKF